MTVVKLVLRSERFTQTLIENFGDFFIRQNFKKISDLYP